MTTALLPSESNRTEPGFSYDQFQLEVSELSSKFNNNVLDSTKAFKLQLDNASDVEGLPPSARSMLAQQAVSEGHKEVRERDFFFILSSQSKYMLITDLSNC